MGRNRMWVPDVESILPQEWALIGTLRTRLGFSSKLMDKPTILEYFQFNLNSKIRLTTGLNQIFDRFEPMVSNPQ